MENAPNRMNSPAVAPKKSRLGHRIKMNQLIWIIAAILIPVVLVIAGWMITRTNTGAYIDDNKYQAVFFTNGQVYFGKLKAVNNEYFKLNKVFYLQTKDKTATDSKNPQQTSTDTTDVELIKLGNEIHGPTDEMIVSKDQVLFFENLKADGTVTKSIEKFNSQK
jgi:hypothetical protein